MILSTAPLMAQDPGLALEFNGSTDYVEVDDTSTVFFGGSSWESRKTLSVWLKPAAGPGPAVQPVTGELIVGNDRPRTFGISRADWNGEDRIWAFNADANGVDFVGTSFTADEWTQITVVHDGGVLSIYRDGAFVDSVASGATNTQGGVADGNLYLGGSSSSRTRHFTGQLDEVRLWDTAVSAGEIATWSNQPIGATHPNLASLAAYYQMEDGSGTVLTDESPNTNTATLLGDMGDSSWVTSGAFGGTGVTPPVAVDDAAVTEEDLGVVIDVAANDTDAGGMLDPATATAVSLPADGSVANHADGTFTYTPDADFNGVDRFDYEICNTGGGCATATVTVTVNPVNDDPVAVDDSAATDEVTSVVIEVAANDTDVDGNLDVTSVQVVSPPASGLAVANPDGTIDYTPGMMGVETFDYEICDTDLACATATVTVTVSEVIAPPVAADDTAVTDEDTAVVIDAGSNDSGEQLDWAASSVTVAPSDGRVTNHQDGTFTYTPDADFNGVDSFEYELCNVAAACATATVTVTVNPVDDDPVAVDDAYGTDEGVDLNVAAPGVLANDTDVDADGLTANLLTDVANGTLTLQADGGFTYEPAAGFSGSDSFTYEACDAAVPCAAATVTITVAPTFGTAGYALEFDGTSDYVVLGETAAMMPAGWEDTKTVSLWVRPQGAGETCVSAAHCDAIFGDRPRWWGISRGVLQGADRIWLWNYDGSFDSIALEYTPDAWVHLSMVHANGELKVYENGVEVGRVASGTTLQPNTGASPVLHFGGIINSPTRDFTFRGQIDELSIWGVERSAQEVATDVHGILAGDETGLVAYYRMSDGAGTTVSDDSGNGWTGTLLDGGQGVAGDGQAALWVPSSVPLSDPPVADPQAVMVLEDSVVMITLTGSDPEGDPLTFSVTSGPANGVLSGTAPDLTYTPEADFNGADSFEFLVDDGVAVSSPATVAITVNPVNDDPVASHDVAATSQDHAVTIGVLDNDSDIDGDPLLVLDAGPAGSGVVENLGSAVRYTPNPGFSGVDQFVYTVSDSQGGTATALVDVTVTPAGANNPPVANPQAVVTDEDTAVAITLTGSDVESDPLTFAVTSGPTNGVLSGTAPNVTYTPNADFNGADSFNFVANDGTDDSAEATVTIAVNAVNDAPVATPDTAVTPAATPVTTDVKANDTDVDGDVLTVTRVGTPANGVAVLNPDETIEYTPNPEFTGTDQYTYTITDGNIETDGVVEVTVSDELVIQEVGFLLTPGDAWGVDVVGSLVYVADVGAGLRIIDVSDPTAPVEIGSLDTNGRTYDVEVVGDYAYLADGRQGLRILNVSDPTNPFEVGLVDTPEMAWDLDIVLPYVYVGDRWGGLRIIDATDPAAPFEVGFYDTPGQAIGVVAVGSIVYVADFDGGLRVFDVTDPTNPTEVEALPLEAPYGLHLDGDYLYVAGGQTGLRILDISTPESPVEISSLSTSGLARSVSTMGAYAFVTGDSEGLNVIDVFDPLTPVWEATVDTPGRARGVAVQDGYAYVADHEGGLRVILLF